MLPVKFMKINSKRRIIVISDIHANYDYLVNLLKKINYTRRDYLFIDGDITEKGPYSLKTLTFIMMLAKHNEVYCVKGNCDNLFYRDFNDPNELKIMWEYVLSTPNSLWWEMFESLGIEVKTIEDFKKAIPVCHKEFETELQFLDNLPTVIETPKITFVHAGLKSKNLMENTDAKFCRKNNAFMETNNVTFDKWVIVGHWPVSNYHEEKLTCDPKFDYEHKVIGIDGGNCIKSFGQLNALIISGIDSMKFSYASYENSPTMVIKKDQKETFKEVPIKFNPESEMYIVEDLGMFTRVKLASTGYRFALPTHKLCQDKKTKKWYCVEQTNFLPKLKKGETVYVYDKNDKYYFIKKDGVLGWYEE